jgi:thiamine biosynthesis lipoprotein
VNVSFPALGTTATLALADRAGMAEARASLDGELAGIDRACSRFRADSELSRLNASGGRRVRVSSLLFAALEVAVGAARATDGLVDPTVGRTLRLAGYDATFRAVAARDGRTFRAGSACVPGWKTIELDEAGQTVRVPAGVELDLGATAKALAADRCARAAATAAGCGVLVGLGGDFAAAGDPPAGGWPIGIADDHARLPDPRSTVAMFAGGMATSSRMVRRWRSASLDLHHLIDPRSGRPARTPWRTVSVAGRCCVEANCASTAALILGEAATAWLAVRRLPARLVREAGAVVLIAGWPEEART